MKFKANPATILGHGFRTFVNEWWQLLVLTVITLIPSLLVTLTSTTGRMTAFSVIMTALSVLFGVAFFIALGKIAHNRFFNDRHTTLGEIFNFIGDKFIPLFLTIIVVALTALVAAIIAAIPIGVIGLLFYGIYTLVSASNIAGIIVAGIGGVIIFLLSLAAFLIIVLHLLFTPYTVLFENRKYFGAVKRAYHMVRNRFWNVLGNWLILMLVALGIAIVVTLIMLPLLMVSQGSAAVTMVVTILHQYASIPVTIALISLFFALQGVREQAPEQPRSKVAAHRKSVRPRKKGASKKSGVKKSVSKKKRSAKKASKKSAKKR